jgi:hypothetical protein
VGVWSGYLATRAGVGLAAPWTLASFDAARRLGSTPIAFVSGRDDPAAVRAQAEAWRVRPCLDVELGIREDGPWVADWLRASGAGLYGLASVHYKPGEPDGRGAAFNIVARFPGFDPGATWDPLAGPRPPGPCGWQWQADVEAFGSRVDRSWLDDSFGGDDMLTDDEKALLLQGARVVTAVDAGRDPNGNPIDVHWLAGYTWGRVQENTALLNRVLEAVAAQQRPSFTPEQIQELATAIAKQPGLVDAIAAAVVRLEATKLGA